MGAARRCGAPSLRAPCWREEFRPPAAAPLSLVAAPAVRRQRLETRGVPGAEEVTDVQGKESKDGRVQRADGGSCSRGSAASGDYQPLLSGAAGGCAIRKLQLNV